MDFNEIIATGVGKDKSIGTVVGRVGAGASTYCRVSTDDLHGRTRSYAGEGEVTSGTLKSFGGYGVVRIPDLQHLLQYLCNNAYEHHVCVSYGNRAGAIADVLRAYKGWEVYQHENAKHC